ncbi:hypothetical protein P7K49_030902 [Saguinus oedipus]|uniref:Fibronectin type-III domain-containing protein n=1 Tax=Saguinus oedipus TaxID=9490 RepID=A0ABQ9U3H9_SAGOE|nr:hypothetical protein P7K49_030902 [Saguinus oedipus]
MKVQPLNQTALQVSWSQPETIYHPPIMNYMISYSWTKNEDEKEKTFTKDSDKDLVGTPRCDSGVQHSIRPSRTDACRSRLLPHKSKLSTTTVFTSLPENSKKLLSRQQQQVWPQQHFNTSSEVFNSRVGKTHSHSVVKRTELLLYSAQNTCFDDKTTLPLGSCRNETARKRDLDLADKATISHVSPDSLYLFRVQAVCRDDMRSDFSQTMLFQGEAGFPSCGLERR